MKILQIPLKHILTSLSLRAHKELLFSLRQLYRCLFPRACEISGNNLIVTL